MLPASSVLDDRRCRYRPHQLSHRDSTNRGATDTLRQDPGSRFGARGAAKGGSAQIGIANSPQDGWLDQAIRDAHSWPSFQHPDKVADAIRLISGIKLWESVAQELGSEAKQVKASLLTIVDRRNKIAHEADMDPTNPGLQWPIDGILVKDALDFVGKLVRAIYKVTA